MHSCLCLASLLLLPSRQRPAIFCSACASNEARAPLAVAATLACPASCTQLYDARVRGNRWQPWSYDHKCCFCVQADAAELRAQEPAQLARGGRQLNTLFGGLFYKKKLLFGGLLGLKAKIIGGILYVRTCFPCD